MFGLADQLVRAIIGVAQKIGFQISCFRYLKTMFIAVVGLMSIALVLWVIVVFVSKYISIPVETKVSLVTGSPPMSMALCRSKYLTQYNYKIKEFQCDIDIEDWKQFSKHTFYLNLFTGVIPFILNIFLNMVILIKLNKYQLIVTTRIGRNEILKILNRIYEENFSIIQTKLSPFNRIRHIKKVFHSDETNFFSDQN